MGRGSDEGEKCEAANLHSPKVCHARRREGREIYKNESGLNGRFTRTGVT